MTQGKPLHRASRMLRGAAAGLAALAVGLALTLPVSAADPDNCLLCHQYRGLGRHDTETDRVHVYFVDPDYHQALLGPHARLACTDCHERAEVTVVPHRPTTHVDCTRICHLSDPRGLERRFSHKEVAEQMGRSVHRPDSLKKLKFTGGPLLDEGQSNCLYCHDEPEFRDPVGAFPRIAELGGEALNRCDSCHRQQVPVDVEYYLRHIASRLQPARPNLEVAQVCAVCHSDKEAMSESGLSDTVASYVRSFHGKAALLGDKSTAGCVDCHASGRHNVHAMVGRDDPTSPVHAKNVAQSCSTIECHPGATPALSEAAVHFDLPSSQGTIEYVVAGLFILLTLSTFGPSAVFALMEMFQIVIGRGHHGASGTVRLTQKLMEDPRGRRKLKRFTPMQRVQHWMLAVLFTVLAITGFPLKFAEEAWARAVVDAFGGLSVARMVHHWSGIALVIGMVGHLVYIAVLVVLRARRSVADGRPMGMIGALCAMPLWITWDDGRKLVQLMQYYAFLRSDRPDFGRFSLKEKFEYIGVFWGSVLLGLTGVLLWGEQYASHVISGRILNLAGIAHTYEAFLAVVHVGILHIYNVMLSPHVFPLSPATLTGDTPVGEMADGHGEFVRGVAAELGVSVDEGHGA